MKISWQTETGHLECRWPEVGPTAPNDLPWLHEAPKHLACQKYPPAARAFTLLSPFGGKQWYAPERRR